MFPSTCKLNISTFQSGVGVIIRYHSTSSTRLPPALQHLMETCHLHVSVTSLTSGRSGAVSGEVSVRLSI